MLHTIHIDDSNGKAKALLEYLKTLDFVRVDELPEWQQTQLDQSLERYSSGNESFTDWNDVKENLYTKFNIK